MKYLIYLSTASIYFQPDSLKGMLTSFQRRNISEEITGLLLYGRGQFLQFIEGGDKSVDKLIKKIAKDTRHHSLIILETGLLTDRVFPEWSMSFKNISLAGFIDRQGFIDPVRPELFSSLQLNHPVVRQLNAFASRLMKTG